jgi:N-acyl-D-aspartate/D-glutamate deacylase
MAFAKYLLFLAAALLLAQSSSFDIVISGPKVIDGSGNPWYYGDIGIRGDAIASVGDLSSARCGSTRTG